MTRIKKSSVRFIQRASRMLYDNRNVSRQSFRVWQRRKVDSKRIDGESAGIPSITLDIDKSYKIFADGGYQRYHLLSCHYRALHKVDSGTLESLTGY